MVVFFFLLSLVLSFNCLIVFLCWKKSKKERKEKRRRRSHAIKRRKKRTWGRREKNMWKWRSGGRWGYLHNLVISCARVYVLPRTLASSTLWFQSNSLQLCLLIWSGPLIKSTAHFESLISFISFFYFVFFFMHFFYHIIMHIYFLSFIF